MHQAPASIDGGVLEQPLTGRLPEPRRCPRPRAPAPRRGYESDRGASASAASTRPCDRAGCAARRRRSVRQATAAPPYAFDGLASCRDRKWIAAARDGAVPLAGVSVETGGSVSRCRPAPRPRRSARRPPRLAGRPPGEDAGSETRRRACSPPRESRRRPAPRSPRRRRARAGRETGTSPRARSRSHQPADRGTQRARPSRAGRHGCGRSAGPRRRVHGVHPTVPGRRRARRPRSTRRRFGCARAAPSRTATTPRAPRATGSVPCAHHALRSHLAQRPPADSCGWTAGSRRRPAGRRRCKRRSHRVGRCRRRPAARSDRRRAHRLRRKVDHARSR